MQHVCQKCKARLSDLTAYQIKYYARTIHTWHLCGPCWKDLADHESWSLDPNVVRLRLITLRLEGKL